jgi:hypothetical protein
MSKLHLTPEQETVLRSQLIDALHPGPLLHDFNLLVDHVGEEGVKAGGKYNLLPIESVIALDPQLARPLCLDLQRPQLRSHPYLQGLHLLLRSSGLSRVEGKGKTARLVIDAAALASWRALNPTEQYFALLEAWLYVSTPAMVGMDDHWGLSLLEQWQIGLTYLPEQEKRHAGNPPLDFLYDMGGSPYNLALAELFGLVALDAPVSGDRYARPEGLKRTPFGKAMFALLAVALQDPEEGEEEEEMDDGAFGRLLPVFQPYFPAWQNSPGGSEPPPTREGVYVFKVTLGRVWRRIALSHEHSLDDLLAAILRSVDFDFDHLYQFTYRDELGRTVRAGHEAVDEEVAAADILLGGLPLEPGQSINLVYDFGDNWKFTVKLERIDPLPTPLKLPAVLEAHGEAPQQYPNWD